MVCNWQLPSEYNKNNDHKLNGYWTFYPLTLFTLNEYQLVTIFEAFFGSQMLKPCKVNTSFSQQKDVIISISEGFEQATGQYQ